MSDDCPIRFQGVTKEDLEKSLLNKSPLTIISYYMGCQELKIPIVVYEIRKYGDDVSFKATATLDDKEWDCCGYIVPKKNEGVMTISLKKS
jgi:hypothetical protein